MAGYTRQSTASIINGSNITAPPLNTEFNQLQAAFNATSGHTHTGGTGDAPKINLATSVSGYLPAVHGGIGGKNTLDATTTPVATNDNSEGYAPGSMWENTNTGRIYICVGSSSGAAVWRELLQVQNGNSILPAATDTVDIGSNTVRFQDLFLSGGIAAAGNTTVGGTLNITGATALGSTLGVTGDTTLANLSATGTTVITSVDLNSGAIDNTTIGSATPASGTFTTLNANTSLVAATADINGGSLDGATVGASVPSTGSFTTLGASGTSTLATVDINGGNIDGTVIGASTKAAGSFTTLSTTGQATLASADINGGSIDGSTIGANSTSTGAFTTLTASGGITGSLTGNVSGNVTGNVTGAVTGNVTGNLTGNVTSSGSSSFNNVTIDGTLNMNAGTTATITNLTTPQNSGDAASKGYVDSEISALIGDAGAGLDTLGELADALNDDDAFSTTVTNSIATKLPKSGGTMTGAIAMSTNKITGVGNPTSAQDVSTKLYTDTQRDTRVAKTGDTMSGALAMGNNKITGLGTPTATTDASSKQYVDGLFQSTVAAATSATNAATSETNAATSETNASNSAAAALVSQNAAALSYDNFDDRYLGAKSSAPTVDNDGDALITGALYFNSTTNIMNVYGSGGWQSAGSAVNGTSERNTYTATAGQTVFAATYDTGYIDVYLNGVKLLSGTDFTATNGTSITLASGASVNDVVDIVAYGTFALADHYTKTASDARYVQPTHTGNLNITGTVTSDGLTVERETALTYGSIDINGTNDSSIRMYNSAGTANFRKMDIRYSAATGYEGLYFRSINDANNDFNEIARFDTKTGDISFYEATGTTPKFFWDASTQRLGIGNSAPNTTLDITTASNTNGFVLDVIGTAPNYMFDVRDDGTSKFRIDSNGNLLVGTTDDVVWNNSANSAADNGHNLRDDGRAGFAFYSATANANATVNINRTGSDGDLIRLFKSGTNVGSIGVGNSNDLTIGTADTGLVFQDNERISPWNPSTGSLRDAAIDFGDSDRRFKDLYLSGSIANPSGDLTVDVLGDINLDAGGTDIYLKTQGNSWGHFMTTSNNFYINSTITDGDIIFQGVDGGSGITALTLDMSNAGAATFNGKVTASARKTFAPRYENSNSYGSNFGWDRIQLGNNGTNKIIAGNTTAGGSLLFVVNNSVDLVDATTASGTNGVDAMKIDSSGRVGIGASSPTAMLDVQNNAGSLSSTLDDTAEFHRADGTYNPRLQIRHSTTGTDLHHTYSTGASNLTFSVANTERMRIDNSGRVTMPYQPAFMAKKTSSQEQSATTNTKITFGDTDVNVGSHYDNTNHRFTAPVAGTYLFAINLRLGAESNLRVITIALRKNGNVTYGRVFGQGAGNDYGSGSFDHPYISGSTIISLNANDYVEMWTGAEITNSGSLVIQQGNGTSQFMGYLIG